MTHTEFVHDLLSTLTKPSDPATTIALAQVHATMALVEAVEGWRTPVDPITPAVPFEQTREGWRWNG